MNAGHIASIAKAAKTVASTMLDLDVSVGKPRLLERADANADISAIIGLSGDCVGGEVNSPRGSMMGGTLHCLSEIELAELGSEANTQTVVYLGSSPRIQNLIGAAQRKIDARLIEITRLQDKLDMLSAGGGQMSANCREEITLTMCEQAALQDAADVMQGKLNRLVELRDALQKSQLTVHGVIHEGTVLVTPHGAVRFNKDTRGPITVSTRKDGSLVFQRDLAQTPQPIGLIAHTIDWDPSQEESIAA